MPDPHRAGSNCCAGAWTSSHRPAWSCSADVDDEFVAEFDAIISSVVYGLLGRFVAGEIASTDILPILDRTVYWVTQGYESTRKA